MEENTITTNIKNEITEKKMSDYGPNYDFVGASELTVTITVAEYRSLLQKEALREKDTAVMENYELKTKVSTLNKEIEVLKRMISNNTKE